MPPPRKTSNSPPPSAFSTPRDQSSKLTTRDQSFKPTTPAPGWDAPTSWDHPTSNAQPKPTSTWDNPTDSWDIPSPNQPKPSKSPDPTLTKNLPASVTYNQFQPDHQHRTPTPSQHSHTRRLSAGQKTKNNRVPPAPPTLIVPCSHHQQPAITLLIHNPVPCTHHKQLILTLLIRKPTCRKLLTIPKWTCTNPSLQSPHPTQHSTTTTP